MSVQDIWNALDEVKDPELPVVSLVELGVVRAVSLDGGHARVALTPTFSGCPALRVMTEEVKAKLEGLGLAAEVETVLAPPWRTDLISAAARAKLEAFGIAPPQPGGAGPLLSLESPPARCPRCGSFDTALKNPFGPTLCKALYACNACQEPFEQFKTL